MAQNSMNLAVTGSSANRMTNDSNSLPRHEESGGPVSPGGSSPTMTTLSTVAVESCNSFHGPASGGENSRFGWLSHPRLVAAGFVTPRSIQPSGGKHDAVNERPAKRSVSSWASSMNRAICAPQINPDTDPDPDPADPFPIIASAEELQSQHWCIAAQPCNSSFATGNAVDAKGCNSPLPSEPELPLAPLQSQPTSLLLQEKSSHNAEAEVSNIPPLPPFETLPYEDDIRPELQPPLMLSCEDANHRGARSNLGFETVSSSVVTPQNSASASDLRPSGVRPVAAEPAKDKELEEGIAGILTQNAHADLSPTAPPTNTLVYYASPFAVQLVLISRPFFVVFQMVVTIAVWFVCSKLDWDFTEQTSLFVSLDCDDRRHEIWRWFTYQFHHGDLLHLISNLVVLAAAIPQERFQGSFHMCIMFNLGVFGGACCYLVSDLHTRVIGMSGGCYAIAGIYFADLVLNWDEKSQKDKRSLKLELLTLVALVLASVIFGALSLNSSTSHSTHVGGSIGGVFAGLIGGRVIHVKRWKQKLRIGALLLGALLVAFCVFWGQQWPPRDIWEQEPWCWAQRISNQTRFGDSQWHCVRCADASCIESWQQEQWKAPVSARFCLRMLGGFTTAGN